MDKILSCVESNSQVLTELISKFFIFIYPEGQILSYIYILVEHQTQPKKLMPFRILKYLVSIWDLHLKATKITKKSHLPIVYPIIFYTGRNKYKYSTCLFDLFSDNKLAKDILCNPCQLIDLSQISDTELTLQPWYGMFASVMKHAHDKKNTLEFLKQLTKNLQPLAKLKGIDFIYILLRYIIKTYDVDEQNFIKTVKTNLPFVEEETMTVAEQWRQQGMQQGMQIGEQKALETVAANLLKQGMSDDKVSAFTGLSVFNIKALKKTLNTKSVN